MKKRVNKQFK